MVNYQLAHWVNEKRIQKFTDEQIKSYLLKYGYTEDVINESINFIENHQKNDMKMGQPPSAGGFNIGDEHWDTMAVFTFISMFFFPLVALPLGILSLKHIKHNSHLKGKSIAIMGIILGSLSLLILLAYIVFVVWIFNLPATSENTLPTNF